MEDANNKPKKSLRWLKITGIVLASLIVLGGIGYGAYYFMSNSNLEPAPIFSVSTLSGGNFTLTDHLGKVVLLDFMYVDCPPCKDMMPELIALSEEFNESQLVILSIDVLISDSVADLQNFIDTYNATWDFAFDTEELSTAYAVVTLPKTVIIDKEGYITYAESGFSADSNLREKILETMEGKANRINASLGGTMVVAFFAGILSFFSPCAFPMLPGYMAYNLDLLVKTEKIEEEQDKVEDTKTRVRRRVWRSILWGTAAALGIFLFYMIIGLIVSLAGGAAGNWHWVEYIMPAVGGLLIILGILTFTPYSLDMSKIITPIDNLGRKKKKADEETEQGKNKRRRAISDAPQLIQLFFYGITYALASIGCNFPILLGLVLGALQSGSFFNAIMIFLVYSIAMALLMIVITLLVGFSKDALINRLQASTKAVKIISGVLLILAGGFLIGWFLWDRYKL